MNDRQIRRRVSDPLPLTRMSPFVRGTITARSGAAGVVAHKPCLNVSDHLDLTLADDSSKNAPYETPYRQPPVPACR